MHCIEVFRIKMCVLLEYYKNFENSLSCGLVQPVWAGDILILQNQKTLFSRIRSSCSLDLQVGLQYAMANYGEELV